MWTGYTTFIQTLMFEDIFLVCEDSSGRKSFQIWVNNKDSGFSLNQTADLPSGTQGITFADVGLSPFSHLPELILISIQTGTVPLTWCFPRVHLFPRRAWALAALSISCTISNCHSAVRQHPSPQTRKGTEYVGDQRSCALLTRTSSSI
jgi:hypothetical protein